MITSGETSCLTGVTRDPGSALAVVVPLGSISDGTLGTSDTLALRLRTRIGTTAGAFCGGHTNAVGLRLYFDAVDRAAQLTGSTVTP